MQKGVVGSIDWLLQNGGIFGVVIIGLCIALYVLWRDNKAKEKTIADKEEVIMALQEKRIVEAREVLTAMHGNTNALSGMSAVLGSLGRSV